MRCYVHKEEIKMNELFTVEEMVIGLVMNYKIKVSALLRT
nr:MAG TPA_asm: hypothetical protein [Caudoviricetes sp.]